jgi:hypothetical protein
MNKLITIACASVILSSAAFGATQFNGGTYTAGTNLYVTSDFDFTLSSGVESYTAETAKVFAVGTYHAKGNTPKGFGANTEGGLIVECSNAYTDPVAETVLADPTDPTVIPVSQGC